MSLVFCFAIAHQIAAQPYDPSADGRVDIRDFAVFQNCFSGSNAPPTGCVSLDLDGSQAINVNDYALFHCAFQGPETPVAPITVDPMNPVTGGPTASIEGAAPAALSVQVSGAGATIVAPTERCRWNTVVSLQPNRVNQFFVSAVYADGSNSPAVPVTIAQDSSAPRVFIDYPASGAQLTTPTIDVAGRVNDSLSGFDGLSVSVNGAIGTVFVGVGAGGTFLVPQLTIAPGPNSLTARAVDSNGNIAEHTISITRVDPPANAATIEVISGNSQTAPVHQGLAQPIHVRLLSALGEPLGGKVVTFKVTRSDGRLGSAAVPFPGQGKMLLQAISDQNGEARAFWRLGSDAGVGNNRVEVTSTGVVGTAAVCASATPGPATQINIGSGNNQRAAAGSQAPLPLEAWVIDGCNPVSGVAVTFTVLEGLGTVNGNAAAEVITDPTGHARVGFTTGIIPGQNVIEATFAGNPNTPARFVIQGAGADPNRPARFSGQIVNEAQQPLEGARCRLLVGETTMTAASNSAGVFAFEQLGATGPARLLVEGSTVFRIGVGNGTTVPLGSFTNVEFDHLILANVDNTLPFPIKLARLDPLNQFPFDNTEDIELTVAGVEGFSVLVRAGSVVLADGSIPSPSAPVLLSLNVINVDSLAMPFSGGAAPALAWFIEPAGARFNPPAEIKYPNTDGFAPGTVANFLQWNQGIGDYEIIASCHVTDDGQFFVSDPGSGISVAGTQAPVAAERDGQIAAGSEPAGFPGPIGACAPYSVTAPVVNPFQPCGADCEQPPASCDSGGAGGGDTCSPGLQCAKAGDPIEPSTGEFVWEQQDLRIPGRGFDFVWKRTYRSLTRHIGRTTVSSCPGTPLEFAPRTSGFGVNWDHSYNIFLGGNIPAGDSSPRVLRLYDGTGRIDSYTRQEDGTWLHPEFFRVIFHNPDGSYTLKFPDQRTLDFLPLEDAGDPRFQFISRIVRITDRNGNMMTFSYDAGGRLGEIVDTLGRSVNVAYDQDGHISALTDFAGRSVEYTYYESRRESRGNCEVDYDGDLRQVVGPRVTGTPTGNDFDPGKTTTYVYSPVLFLEQRDHNLVAIVDGKGQEFVHNTYELLNSDRVISQRWGDADDVLTINYSRFPPVAENEFTARRTTVNDRVGNVTEYFFDDRNRLVKKREYTGRSLPGQEVNIATGVNVPTGPLRPDDPPFFETRWVYNDDSRVVETIHPNGNVATNVYEKDLNPEAPRLTHGNVREIHYTAGTHTPVGDQAEIVEQFEYDTGKGGCCGFNFVTRYEDGRENETLHDYDERGNRIHTQHAIPTIVEDWEYNEFGQMTAVIKPDNGSGHRRRVEFTYYESGPHAGYLEYAVTDASGFALTTTYEYDVVGNLVRKIDPRGNDTQYVVNQLNQVVREITPEVDPGSGIRYQKDYYYDANNNLVRVDVQNVDENGMIQPNSHFTTIHEYEILNKLVRTCEEVGSYTGTIPGTVDLPTCDGLPDSEFATMEYAYDANRNRTLVRYPEAVERRQLENEVAFEHDERDKLFRSIRAPGSAIQSTTQYDYDGNGNRKAVREGLENDPRVATYVYDAFNREIAMTDAMGNVSSYHYDASGNRTATRVDGELIDVPGSDENVRLSEKTHTYDPVNRRTVESRAFFDVTTQAPIMDGLAITTYAYSDNSQVLSVTDDNGHSRTFSYDTANRIATTTDAKGNITSFAYDAGSNIAQITEVDKSDLGSPDETFVTEFAHDGLDRRTQVVDNIGNTTQTAYDSRGNRVRTIDARGNMVRKTYDGLNRELAIVRLMTDTGDGTGTVIDDITTVQGWDDSSRLVGQTDDNGNTLTTIYDGLSRKIGERYADGTLHTFGYDVHGNQVTRTDANGTTVDSQFDLKNRVIRRDVDRAPGILGTTFEIFKFDGLSRLVHAEDDDSLVTRTWDSLSHVLTETQGLDGFPDAVVTGTFDGVGNQLTVTYPSGRVVTHTFDELNRERTISDQDGPIADYAFIGTSRVQQRNFANNTRALWEFDGLRRITRTTHLHDPNGSAEVVDDRTYIWDAMHNKTAQRDLLRGVDRSYAYDSANRLVRSVRSEAGQPEETVVYNLDVVGNRTSVVGGPDDGVYEMDSATPDPADLQCNQYTQTPFDGRSYDENGNLAEIVEQLSGDSTTKSIRHDYRGLMVSFSDSGSSTTAIYKYDALGRRIAKEVTDPQNATQVTRFHLNGWREIQEQQVGASTQATFVHGHYLDDLLATRRDGVDTYSHSDDLFSSRALTDASGDVVETYEYSDYGNPSAFNSSGDPLAAADATNFFLFAGRRVDPETGLLYFRTRYLDGRVGSFNTRDSIGAWGDARNTGNARLYAGANPLSRLDAYGLTGLEVAAAAVVAATDAAIFGGASAGGTAGAAVASATIDGAAFAGALSGAGATMNVGAGTAGAVGAGAGTTIGAAAGIGGAVVGAAIVGTVIGKGIDALYETITDSTIGDDWYNMLYPEDDAYMGPDDTLPNFDDITEVDLPNPFDPNDDTDLHHPFDPDATQEDPNVDPFPFLSIPPDDDPFDERTPPERPCNRRPRKPLRPEDLPRLPSIPKPQNIGGRDRQSNRNLND